MEEEMEMELEEGFEEYGLEDVYKAVVERRVEDVERLLKRKYVPFVFLHCLFCFVVLLFCCFVVLLFSS